MPAEPIAVEHLLSRKVHDPSGRSAGRIEEIRTTPSEDALLVYQYDLGPAALLERLAVGLRRFPLLRKIGVGPERSGRCVPWDKMDLSDPRHPRITCPREELQPIER
ncbi:MAG TPA: hypothetical protein VFK04_02655 [Gemmatimonadaceae bacterium]|jgi:hypothetical protein|nr:hypothetical protein [Gemmatimonadaceae bacterium]